MILLNVVKNILKLKLIIDNTNIIILCTYVSSSSDNHKFFSTLVEIDNVKIVSDCFIIIDGMNINVVGIKLVDNEYLDKLSEYGFVSFINVYSRPSFNFRHFKCDCQPK